MTAGGGEREAGDAGSYRRIDNRQTGNQDEAERSRRARRS